MTHIQVTKHEWKNYLNRLYRRCPKSRGMYSLVFGKGPKDYVVLASGSLMEMIKQRAVSGDLILNPRGEILQGTTWMFPWEQKDPNCYARRCQTKGWTS